MRLRPNRELAKRGWVRNDAMMPDDYQDHHRPKRPPPPMTAARLRQLAEDYVGRFGGPSSNLRRYLQRHLDKARRAHATQDEDLGDFRAQVEAIVAEFLAVGALDDAKFAQLTAAHWVQRGVAPRLVAQRLRNKGIGGADVQDALSQLGSSQQTEWHAALQLARRRRLGPFRPADERAARRLKDVAALARAGFSAHIAFKVVGLSDAELHEQGDP